MSIQEHLNKIRNAIKGSEVRESIAKGIETAYDDASEKDNANMEVKIARGTNPNLNTRLNNMDETDKQTTKKIDSNHQETTAQLAQKANQTEVRKNTDTSPINVREMDTETKALFTGGAVAIVGEVSVGKENVKPKAVSMIKTDFISTGKNLFNPDDAERGKILSQYTGATSDSSSYFTSGYIEVLPSTDYAQNNSSVVAFYDINKTFISALGTVVGGEPRTFTTPENAYFIRTSRDDFSIVSTQIELGTVSTEFESYKVIVKDLSVTVPVSSVDEEQLVNGSVTLEKLGFAKMSANLFNKDTASTGYYVNHIIGNLASNASYFSSDFIDVEENQQYIRTNAQLYYAFYDIHKAFIQDVTTTTDPVITSPEGAKYLRISGQISSLPTFMLVKGDVLPDEYIPYRMFIPKEYIERGDSSSPGTLTRNTDHFGKYNLKNWQAVASQFTNPNHEGRIELALIGDSWVQGAFRLATPLKHKLHSIYGDGGVGFIGFANNHWGNGTITLTATGSWEEQDSTTTAKGLDVSQIESSTVGDSISLRVVNDNTSLEVHTVLQEGSYRYKADDGEWVVVDTSVSDVTLIDGLTTGVHDFDFEVVSGTVTFLGAFSYNGSKGAIVHKIGNGGTKAFDYSKVDRANYIEQLRKTNVDTFALLLGTNDMSGNAPIDEFKTQIIEICNRIKEAKPLSDIILIAPSGNNLTNRLHTIQEYGEALYEVAVSEGLAFVSLYDNLGSYEVANARGLYGDGVHPNTQGGYVISNVVYDRLLRVE